MIAIDTNILVYAFDITYNEKREICKNLITNIFEGKEKGMLTNQILAEFANAVTKKIEKPISKQDAKSIIGAIIWSENWEIKNYNSKTILKTLDSEGPFWDLLIAETLKEANIKKIVTENEKDFKDLGLDVENPLKKLREWGQQ